MSILALTIPATLLLAAVLLGLVVRAVLRGDFDDWEGPAARHFLDDDSDPERDGTGPAAQAGAPPGSGR